MSDVLVEQKYYVYVYQYPDGYIDEEGKDLSGAVFYVGKGTGRRINFHDSKFACHYGENLVKHAIIQQIVRKGMRPAKNKVYGTCREEDAYLYEWVLINMVYGIENLTNVRGGSGQSSKPAKKYLVPKKGIITMHGETYYSGFEATNYLGISYWIFRKYVQPGLREHKYGALHRVFYRKADLEQYKTMKEQPEGTEE